MKVDFAQEIRDMKEHVTMRAETDDERAERTHRRVFPESPAPETRWRIDWAKVRGAERWLHEEWAPTAEWEIIERTFVGNLTLSARVRRRPRGESAVLPEGAPPGARHIHGVLISRCAGYRHAPKTDDIVKGITSETPSETEAKAIRSYVREASRKQVEAAWKAGEFSLSSLMRCIDRVGNHNSLRGLSSVRRWLIVENIQ